MEESDNPLIKLLKAQRRLRWIRRLFSLGGLLVIVTFLGLFIGGIAILGTLGGSGQQTADTAADGDSDLTSTGVNAEVFYATWVHYYTGSVMENKEKAVIAIAKKYGVSPALMAAIIGIESGWGKSAAIRNKNNPSGQMRGNEILAFPTLNDGIEATGQTLNALVVREGLVTVETLGARYAPVGASNDGGGLNVNWVSSVKKMMQEFGGTSGLTASGGSGAKPNSKGWVYPLQPYQVTSPFMMGRQSPTRPGKYENHYGIDLVGSLRINAAKDGTVVLSEMRGDYGLIVILKHSDGWYSSYQHLSSSKVKVGQKLKAGQQLGIMGQTGDSYGAHLHFMIMRNYLFSSNPGYIDPATVIDFK
jgi:murein DD-endopeptidase MepM/ murein hydrolase activator NlpD